MKEPVVHHAVDTVKHFVDAASTVIVVGTLFSFLPAISAALSATWFAIRIYETDTVQKVLRWLRGALQRQKKE